MKPWTGFHSHFLSITGRNEFIAKSGTMHATQNFMLEKANGNMKETHCVML